MLDVAATDLLNKSFGSPAATPLHLVVSCCTVIGIMFDNDVYGINHIGTAEMKWNSGLQCGLNWWLPDAGAML